jgi:hypothetical protein
MNLPPLNEQSIKNEAWRNGKERRRLASGGRNVEERPGDGWMDGMWSVVSGDVHERSL